MSPPPPARHPCNSAEDTTFALALALGLAAVQAPFLDRPVNYDEANFLTLTRGALANPWAPHDVLINWQGKTERAFDVLSNPPGIAWFLAAVQRLIGDGIGTQRASMLLWALPMAFGAVWLARAFSPPGEVRWRATGLLAMPMALMSGSALLPDAPLYALTLLGMGGLATTLGRPGAHSGTGRPEAMRAGAPNIALWALVAGSACLFRYSAVCLIPLVGLLGLRSGRAATLWVLLPITLLEAHDLSAYGSPHLLAMGHFQSVSNTGEDWAHKGASALTFLGGALVLPIFRWESLHLLGALFGGLMALQFGTGWQAAEAAAFGAAGGAALASGIRALLRTEERWLGLWATGGFVFLLALRFTAARYWLPFAPPILLLAPFGGPPAVAISAGLGIALLADDRASAHAVADLADHAATAGDDGPGVFTGHWGWQWAMEQRGWKALDEGERAPAGALLAMPTQAWPQPVEAVCLDVMFHGVAVETPNWLPRAYSAEGHANLHANWIVGHPPIRTVIPWTFATDPVEDVSVCRE